MLHSLAITTPFLVCLFWFALFLLHASKGNQAQRFLCFFFATAAILYFCHLYYFSSRESLILEALWTICSLSVYPLYYEYLRRLTKGSSTPVHLVLMLIPGILVGLSKFFVPFNIAEIARQILNTVQMILVCFLGIRLLRTFSQEISKNYADTKERDVKSIRVLLLAIVLTSVISVIASILGRRFCFSKDVIVNTFSLIFSTLLFMLGYIGLTQTFSFEQLCNDTPSDNSGQEPDSLGEKLEELMTARNLYLTHDLKINDVAIALGTCRTYVSNHINQSYGCTFSEYINRKRIEYAKSLLQDGSTDKMVSIAQKSGFSTEQSFYTNFKKYVHTSPHEWMKKNCIQCK